MSAKRTIVIDIETLPAESVDSIYLKPEEREDQATAIEALNKTSLNGDFGRVLCIGFSDERSDGYRKMELLGWDKANDRLHANEVVTLDEFWQRMRRFDVSRDVIVGHNVFGFDLQFIIKRSIICRVRPTVRLSFAKYRSQPIFDTMCEWECWGFPGKISLDKLAHALSLPTSKSDEVNGARIAELFAAGRHHEIRDYCLEDVRLTRNIYKRITFTTDDDVVGLSSTDSRVPARVIS